MMLLMLMMMLLGAVMAYEVHSIILLCIAT